MSAGAVRQGRVYVEIGADARKLYAALGNINKRIGSIGQTMMAAGSQMMALGAGIATPILGAAAAFSQVGDAVQKMAARTGLSTEAVSALGFAAGQSGTDIGSLEKGVRTMQRTLDDAANIGGRAAEAFQRLGVDVDALRQMSPEQQFMALAEAIGSVADPGERAALAMQVFGRAGTALLPMFADGADGIQKLVDQASQLGIVMDQQTADSAARLNDSIGELQTALKAIVVTVGAAVAPALSGMASAFAVIAGQASRYINENREVVQQALAVGAAMVGVGGAITAAGFALKALSIGISGIAGPLAATVKTVYQLAASFVSAAAGAAMYTVKAVVAATTSMAAWIAANAPLAIAVGLLGAAAGAAVYAAGGFSGLADMIGGGFAAAGQNAASVLSDLGATASATFGGIYEELTAGNLTGAMDILWLGLKAGWLRGTEALMGFVDSWVAGFQNTWTYLGTSIAVAWESMWSGIVQGSRTFGAVLQGAFDNVINGVLAAWDTMEAAVRKSWNWVQSFIQRGYDLAKENAKVNDEMTARSRARAAQRPGVAARVAQVEGANAETARQAQQNIDAMRQAADATAQARLDENARRAAGRRAGVVEAEGALADALAESAVRAAERAAEEAQAPSRQQIEGGAGAAAAGMNTGDIAGTFSAAALGGLGLGRSLAQKQVDLLQQIADNTEEDAALVGA